MTLAHPLLAIACVLVAGVIGGELVARAHLPKVTGWIGTGIVLRAMGLPGLEPDTLGRFSPFTDFVLGYIAFTVGAALHMAGLRNAGKRLFALVLTEAIITPLCVAGALIFLGKQDLGVALVLAAIAVAGAPGTTVIVVREARARGVFVKTLVAAVALIDMVAVGSFAFVLALVRRKGDALALDSIAGALGAVGIEFAVAAVVGVGCTMAALLLLRTVVGPAFLGPLMVAVILGSWGLAKGLDASSILACTFAGVAVSNIQHTVARSAEAYLHPLGGVLFAGFYTLAGMRLDFSLVVPMAMLVGLFFGSRALGKSLSAFLAMTVAQMTPKVRKYLGIALLPHGGVAVGLILFVQQEPTMAHMRDTVAAVGLAALALNQLIGPSATRAALKFAGEAGLDRPRLLDFLREQDIVVPVGGTSKREVIETLVNRLYATHNPEVDKATFLEQVLKREEEEPTCLGEGFMIPHGAIEEGSEVMGVLGISREGIDLDAPDGRPVHAIVLLATPAHEKNRHLEILAAFASAITRNPNLREQLYHARSAARAYEILHADDTEDFNYFLDETMAPSVSKASG
jgi:mannitol/fructose-specific phosphotransferase system IIA component (Ntr-type)/Kef-type K+ transport system membrane component KefB